MIVESVKKNIKTIGELKKSENIVPYREKFNPILRLLSFVFEFQY